CHLGTVWAGAGLRSVRLPDALAPDTVDTLLRGFEARESESLLALKKCYAASSRIKILQQEEAPDDLRPDGEMIQGPGGEGAHDNTAKRTKGIAQGKGYKSTAGAQSSSIFSWDSTLQIATAAPQAGYNNIHGGSTNDHNADSPSSLAVSEKQNQASGVEECTLLFELEGLKQRFEARIAEQEGRGRDANTWGSSKPKRKRRSALYIEDELEDGLREDASELAASRSGSQRRATPKAVNESRTAESGSDLVGVSSKVDATSTASSGVAGQPGPPTSSKGQSTGRAGRGPVVELNASLSLSTGGLSCTGNSSGGQSLFTGVQHVFDDLVLNYLAVEPLSQYERASIGRTEKVLFRTTTDGTPQLMTARALTSWPTCLAGASGRDATPDSLRGSTAYASTLAAGDRSTTVDYTVAAQVESSFTRVLLDRMMHVHGSAGPGSNQSTPTHHDSTPGARGRRERAELLLPLALRNQLPLLTNSWHDFYAARESPSVDFPSPRRCTA
ncbi:unnamed protein product, partial [Amoebophrya sp. A25]